MRSALLVSCVLVCAPLASATVMLSPVGLVQNALGERNAGVGIANAFDGSGLPAFTSGVTNFDTYLAGDPRHTFAAGGEWFAPNGAASGIIDWDLGASLVADRVAIWNEDAHGVERLTIRISDDPTFAVSTLIGTFDLSNTTRTANYAADVLSLGGPAARYVRFEILSSFLDEGIPTLPPTASLGEVVFSVPSPGVISAAAIAGVAGARRRRG